MGKMIAMTDIQIQVPEGCYGRVAPRSGLAAKFHIDIGGNNFEKFCLNWSLIGSLMFSAGVIDKDYRGNVGVVMFNHSQDAFDVKKGDRIAQLICEQIMYPDLEEVDVRF